MLVKRKSCYDAINQIFNLLDYLKHGRLKCACSIEICNGNRTEWSPIRSVIIRVITKSDDRAAGVRFFYHDLSQLIIKITVIEKNGQVAKKGESSH